MKSQKKKRKMLKVNSYILSANNGFTLIEILITSLIAVILLTLGLTNLIGFNTQKKLDNNSERMVSLLRNAQQRSINQEASVRWGVSFYNDSSNKDSYTLFQVNETLLASSSYSNIPGTSTEHYSLSSSLDMADPTVGNRSNIVFNKFSGDVDATDTIIIQLKSSPSNQRTITVNTNGRIDSE